LLRSWLFSQVETFAYRASDTRQIRGVAVSLLGPREGDWEAVESKLASALDLIALHAPVRFGWLLRDTDGIWVVGDGRPAGAWVYRLRAIRLSLAFCLDPRVTAALLACTLVHEATHAYLWRLGFRYPEDQRAQTERICKRSERVFLQRVPGEARLLEWKRSQPEPVAGDYSNQAYLEHARAQLREIDAPKWVTSLLGLRSAAPAAESDAAADGGRD
jgi:hypothetical protein